ncbi:MAG: YfhO family protein [Oscillospiraceae bacterium]|nr:YfhO family protein [Oscillospiraceae bacterium]
MELPKLSVRKFHIHILSFAIPFFGILTIMLFGQYSPFGQYSMLYSDMYHQYFPFFKTFRAMLLSGDSLLYNWNIGMGLDYLGLYSYYLASPLNFLSILVPEGWLLGYFSLLVPIKLGLASMFFGIFLEKIFDKRDLSIPLFGSYYGLCAWALGYQWNVMWLDTFALLPLVMLGMVSLLRDKKFVLYTVTLFLSVYINYYIGLFTCFFVFLGFFCYEICRFKNVGKFFADLSRIALFSALAIGMTAILSLPTLAALQNTQSSVNTFPEGFQLNMTSEHNWMGLFKTMAAVAGNMNGGITHTFKEGMPNLYCGIITTVLAFVYLFCKEIRLRDKICAVVLLLFFNVSFIVRQLDYIWHGFHFTNMIPYRFSFLYSFVLLYMAYSAWCHRKSFQLWQIITAGILAIGIMFCYEDWSDLIFWAYNGAFLLIYIAALIYYSIERPVPEDPDDVQAHAKKQMLRKGICSLALLGVMMAELILNLTNFGMRFPATNTANYPKGKASTQSVLDYMEELEKDTLFYRAEVTHSQTLNDGALNGYRGISTFTSSANVKVTEFMRALGYGAKNTYNRYCFEESTPVGNLFLGLKYMIERDGNVEKNSYFDDIYSVDKVHLLENNTYLPLGFLANSQLLNVKFSSDGYRFSFQNTLMRNATGVQKDVWHTMPGRTLTITGDCPTLKPQPNTGYCDYVTEDKSGIITYSYTADREGFLCINLDLSKRNNFTIRLNDETLYSETYSLTQMLAVGDVQIGDVVEIELKCKENEKGTIKISAGILNEELFRQGYETLAASVLEVTEFSNTRVVGKINCNRDGVLYTSIPQDGNWSACVDGQPAEIVLIGDAMIGLLMSEGEHIVEFTYHNDTFSLGWKVSLAFLIVFIGIYLAVYKPKFQRYQGRYLKK